MNFVCSCCGMMVDDGSPWLGLCMGCLDRIDEEKLIPVEE